MPEQEPFEVDPLLRREIDTLGKIVVNPAVERNFGDESANEFNAGTNVLLPTSLQRLPGETPEEAHIRLQAQQGGQ